MSVNERLRTMRERAGLSRATLAKELGYAGPSSIQRYEEEERFTKDWLPPDIVDGLKRVLIGKGNPPITLSEIESLGYEASAVSKKVPQNIKKAGQDAVSMANIENANATVVGDVSGFARRIPLFGQAIGGEDGQFILNGTHIADILAPAVLDGVRGAYAVQVVGDSMSPRYEAGEIAFVNPHIAVRKADYVVVQIATGEGEAPLAYVKRFVKRTADLLVLEQFNPAKELTFAWESVVSVHRIIMAGERA